MVISKIPEYLLLLGVAVPLKYPDGQPLTVRVVVAIYGGLFLLYLVAVVRAGWSRRWPVGLWLAAVLAAIIPCGPFLLGRRLRREEARIDPGGTTEG